jgi:hypothetical protein
VEFFSTSALVVLHWEQQSRSPSQDNLAVIDSGRWNSGAARQQNRTRRSRTKHAEWCSCLMWSDQFSVAPYHMPSFGGGQRMSKSAPCSPVKPPAPPVQKVAARADSFHVLHKVPTGDTPYVRAKHVQVCWTFLNTLFLLLNDRLIFSRVPT